MFGPEEPVGIEQAKARLNLSFRGDLREAAANLEFEEAARLRDEVKRLQATELAIGNDPRVWLVEDQVELTPEKFIQVEGRSSKTSIPGVFAAGDVIDPTYRQAITAAGSGCVAALDAEHYLNAH